jgi:uncharacterized protein YggE
MNDASLSVRGEATVETEPDEVRMGILVTVLATTLEAALDEAARRTQELIEVFRGLDLPDGSWRTETVSVQDEQDHTDRGMVHRGYRASCRTVVRLDSPSLVGRLMREATVRSEARIVEGPWWIVAAGNPARLEACREAVRDARRKAEAYAEAMSLRLGPMLHAAEPGVETGPRSEYRMKSSTSLRTLGGSPMMPTEEGRVDVFAEIDMTFALSESPPAGAGEAQRA